MITMAASNFLCGYEYELLVPDVPDEFTCLICTMVAREAHQSGCCGRIFCRYCLELLKKKSFYFTCPNCRESLDQNYFADKNTMRKIRQLAVYCPNKNRVCSWTGELQHVDSHISECPREVVDCPNHCSDKIERYDLEKHLKHSCSRREVICVYCGISGEYQEITGIHKAVCTEIPVLCPNKSCGEKIKQKSMQDHRKICLYEFVSCLKQCGERFERREIGSHSRSKCPKRLVKCKYCDDEGEYAVIAGRHLAEECNGVLLPCPNEGCEEKFKRPFKDDHLGVCPKQLLHCKYVGVCNKAMKREDKEQHYREEMEKHLDSTYSKFQNLELQFQSLTEEVGNLQHLKQSIESLTKEVRDLQHTKHDVHRLSNELVMMKGHFGSLSSNVKKNFELTEKCTGAVSSLSTTLKQLTVPCEDPIIFKVENFSVNGETETFDFYFCKGGHKFRFHVHPNGIGHAKGSYISLTLEVIDGEYDDVLIGSFTNSVSVELLNQESNNNHCIGTFEFTHKKRGIRKSTTIYRFCDHDELEDERSIFTDYIENGNLYFKLECSVDDEADKPWLCEP